MFLEWENNSGKLQIISGNAIHDVKQISLRHEINHEILKKNHPEVVAKIIVIVKTSH